MNHSEKFAGVEAFGFLPEIYEVLSLRIGRIWVPPPPPRIDKIIVPHIFFFNLYVCSMALFVHFSLFINLLSNIWQNGTWKIGEIWLPLPLWMTITGCPPPSQTSNIPSIVFWKDPFISRYSYIQGGQSKNVFMFEVCEQFFHCKTFHPHPPTVIVDNSLTDFALSLF